jgi:hypothetical protein
MLLPTSCAGNVLDRDEDVTKQPQHAKVKMPMLLPNLVPTVPCCFVSSRCWSSTRRSLPRAFQRRLRQAQHTARWLHADPSAHRTKMYSLATC